MPYKEPVIEKIYTIGEVAEMFNEKISCIRFWSDQFKGFINPSRNKKGNRLFTERDIENIRIIYHLIKEKGLTIEGAKKRMKENKKGENHNLEIINTLKDIRNTLLEVEKMI